MNLEQIKNKKKNKKRNRFILRTSILVVLFAALAFALVSNLQADNSVYQVGDQAPDFKLQQINKNNELETIQLSDFKGKGVMLNFWGTWCKPCEKEMPYMQALYPKYKEKGIEIIAVSLDNTELVVGGFIDKYDLTFPVPHDKTGEVRDLYNIGPIPSTIFINPDGKIERTVIGALTLESLEGYLQEILPEQ
ncbi:MULTISPECIES: thiol-disulfide oxidoreductase ResA [Oceanobacillus]|uniref:Thiol-disulfide oxidoreductase ResA n=1 Tax=Oceanobacillus kimchii TaxID=746691 RepID=A0ABQ5TQY0_9BACI|nr:thiol-disulfide oxidoreductase ResA [Oceanobacillus kimchii]GLO68354.1 thiol-disulfide oxidoreductase ResA [Oceanobacillus kimchii]